MTPLEAARRIAELAIPLWDERFSDSGVCPHCGEYRKHASDCVMRAMPRIVAALEAAKVIADLGDPISGTLDCCIYCLGPAGPYPDEHLAHHEPDCRWQTFVAALKGEEITA